MMETLEVKTNKREEMLDVTSRIEKVVSNSKVKTGVVHCFVPHTTAGLTINENADPDVRRDILYKLGKEIPKQDDYHHGEGNSDAHIKASLMGSSELIIIQDGQLVLGTWQGIFFCEFDGPRTRRLHVQVSERA